MPKTKFDSTFLLRCVCFSSPNPSSSINQRIIETQGAAHRDIGADSVTSLPLREWAHVAFTFKNHSKLSSAAGDLGDSSGGVVEHQQPPPPPELVGNVHGHHFSFGFFLNGYHDVTANFPAPVEANGDDLRVGKDPSNRGPRGTLLAHPKLWVGALGWDDAKREHDRGRSAFFADGAAFGSTGSGAGDEDEDEAAMGGVVGPGGRDGMVADARKAKSYCSKQEEQLARLRVAYLQKSRETHPDRQQRRRRIRGGGRGSPHHHRDELGLVSS